MTPLPPKLKKAAEDAFRNNGLLSSISAQEREEAAQWYYDFASEVKGSLPGLARLYNLERAKFLRGEVDRVAYNAPAFAKEIGYVRQEKQHDT